MESNLFCGPSASEQQIDLTAAKTVMTTDCWSPEPGEIQSTLILQFIEPKRINYVYLLILKWSYVHAPLISRSNTPGLPVLSITRRVSSLSNSV